MKLFFQDKTLCLSSSQDLILFKGDSNIFNWKSLQIPQQEPYETPSDVN